MEKYTADRLVTINVDIQNDFLEGGSLAVPGGNEVIDVMNTLNTYTRLQNGLVVFTGDQHPDETPHFNIWPKHCVAGTEGAALHPDLQVLAADIIVDKGMEQTDGYSAFEGIARDGRTLEQIIQPTGQERVAVLMGGVATEYCVLNSALDNLKVAVGAGALRLFVVRDAIRAVNIKPNDGANAIALMGAAGATFVKSQDILDGKVLEFAQQ